LPHHIGAKKERDIAETPEDYESSHRNFIMLEKLHLRSRLSQKPQIKQKLEKTKCDIKIKTIGN
jgi:hypothetical protein